MKGLRTCLVTGLFALLFGVACGDKGAPTLEIGTGGSAAGTGGELPGTGGMAGGTTVVTGTGGAVGGTGGTVASIDSGAMDGATTQADTGGTVADTSPPPSPDTAPKVPSFSTDIQPLIKRACSCHATASGFPPPLDTYANVKASATVSDSAMQKGTMPSTAPLPAADKALFHAWVTAGAPNN
jgi:hypothetical protein